MMIQSFSPNVMIEPKRDILHHLRMEPFQVFCHERRPAVSHSNPSLSSSKITAILGLMWRSLKPYQKQAYIDVAVSMMPRETPKIISKDILPKPIPKESLPRLPDISTLTQSIESPPKLVIPCFDIIPRGTNWDEVSKLTNSSGI